MSKYGDIYINLKDIIVEHDDNKEFLLTKDTKLFFVYIHNEPYGNKQWVFYLDENLQNRVFIPEHLVKENIKNYFLYYQEQFSHLDQNNSYFGQVLESSHFVLSENGEKNYYEKIGEYITKEGIKYNAVKMPKFSNDYFWVIDDEEYYKDKEFCFFKPDQKIDTNLWYMDKYFKIPKPIEVSELVLEFPDMLEVIECLFKKQNLKELRVVYENYHNRLVEAEEFWHSFDSIPITEVQTKIEENKKAAQRQQILNEIEKETAQFKQNLINKRLKF